MKSRSWRVGWLMVLLSAAMCARAVELLPQPREMNWTGREVTFDTAAVQGPDGAAREELRAALSDHGVRVVESAAIVFRLQLQESLAPEEYRLAIADDGVTVDAGSDAGLLYGAATLGQLLSARPDGAALPSGTVCDRPEFPWRGVYLSLTGDSAADQEKLLPLIRRLALLKLNKIYLGFAPKARYRSFDMDPNGFSPEFLRRANAYARRYHIEIIPYFQALSHAVWFQACTDNPAVFEGINAWATAWCPSNPEAEAIFTAVLNETIDIFKPRYIHLGLDEISMCAWRICPACRAVPPEELLLRSIDSLHRILAARGVGMIMWHDELMPLEKVYTSGPEAASHGYRIVDRLPRDIVINIWDYASAPDAETAEYWRGKGFPLVTSGCDNPENLLALARLYPPELSLGIVNTYWTDANRWLAAEISAAAATGTVACAAAAWNPDAGLPAPDAANRFFTLPWLHEVPDTAGRFKSVVTLPEQHFGFDTGTWPGAGLGVEAGWPDRVIGPDRSGFRGDGSRLWVHGGGATAPELPLNARADWLNFVHACAIPEDAVALNSIYGVWRQPPVGRYVVTYADGKTVDIPLYYRREITDWNAAAMALKEDSCYLNPGDGSFVRCRFGSFWWKNPRPEAVIRSIAMAGLPDAGAATFACAELSLWSSAPQTLPTTAPAADAPAGTVDRPDRMVDDFAYADAAGLAATWRLIEAGRGVETGRSADGEHVVTFTIPAAKGKMTRVCLERQFDFTSFREADSLFFLPVQVEGAQVQFSVYAADADWSQYICHHEQVKPGTALLAFAPSGFRSEPPGRDFDWSRATRLRFAFWLAPGDTETRVTLGPLVYGSKRKPRTFQHGLSTLEKNYFAGSAVAR